MPQLPADTKPQLTARASSSEAVQILACDFFIVDLLDGTQSSVLAVIEHASRRIRILAVTPHPTRTRTAQQARNLIMDLGGQPTGSSS
jgi:hypothetical protein